MSKAGLVDKVKALQRSDPEIKQAWWDFCEKDLGGVKDPSRHDESVLETFLSWFDGNAAPAAPVRQAPRAAARPSQQPVMSSRPQLGGFGGGGKGMMGGMMSAMMGMGMGGPSDDLAGAIKLGQKHSPAYKAAWSQYCAMYGGGLNDPNRHDPSYIVSFIDYIGQLAQADLGAAAAQAQFMPQPRMGGGMGGKRSFDAGYGGHIGEPSRKKAAVSRGGGGDDKAALVDRVKALQRRDPDTKAAWWAFTDEHHGGAHDPNRHDADVLKDFLSQYE